MSKRIRETFDLVFGLVIPDLRVRLVVGSPDVERFHRESERQFAATVTRSNRPGEFEVHVVKDAAKLKDGFLIGILLHELGHVLAHLAHGPNHEESDADLALVQHGIGLAYGSPLNIQYVEPDLIAELERLQCDGETLDDLRWSPVTNETYRRKMLSINPYEK